MDLQMRHMIVPIKKEGENYRAVLTDDSVDRDDEFMSPGLIRTWASDDRSLPFLADHDNSMDSMVGAWTDRKLVQAEDGHLGLAMTPNFFSEQANPKAQRIKKQIDEASKMGVDVGLSIGFIPLQSEKALNGKTMHTQAEIVEGSVVPVQSEADKTEIDTRPIMRRTMVILSAYCLR